MGNAWETGYEKKTPVLLVDFINTLNPQHNLFFIFLRSRYRMTGSLHFIFRNFADKVNLSA